MDIEVESRGDRERKPWTHELSGTMIPRYMFLMKTVHGAPDSNKLLETIKGKVTGLSEAVLKEMAAKVAERMTKARGTGERIEWHSVALVEDTQNDKLFALVSRAHTNDLGDGLDYLGTEIIDDEEKSSELHQMIATCYTTAMNHAHSHDWHGERVLRAFEEDIESLEDLNVRMAKHGIEAVEVCSRMYPQAIKAEDMPVLELDPVDKSRQRAALIKRFGAKAIADLEARIAKKA